MDKQIAAQRIADDFHGLEEGVDTALKAAAELTSSLVETRRGAGLSTRVGHDVFAELQQAQKKLTAARGAIVRAHRAAEPIQRLWRTTAQGPTDKGSSSPTAPLRAVI